MFLETLLFAVTLGKINEIFAFFHLYQVRSIISDFAVFFTILTMVLVDYALGIPSPKLKVPSVFKVSYFTREMTRFYQQIEKCGVFFVFVFQISQQEMTEAGSLTHWGPTPGGRQ